jgi:hypothetical protein
MIADFEIDAVVPGSATHSVMAVLVTAIHVLLLCRSKDVDGRNKSGHDGIWG